MKYINGDTYDGYFGGAQGGKRHGQGFMKYQNNNTYTGEWQEDFEQGDGKKIYANGDYYDGKFKQGKPTSENNFYDVNKNKLSQEASKKYMRASNVIEQTNQNLQAISLENKGSGLGEYKYPANDSYKRKTLIATFKEGKTNKGKLEYTNKDVYEGELTNGQLPCGKGIKTLVNGDVYDGKFVAGAMIEGTITYKNGCIYEGKCNNTTGLPDGRAGKLTYNDGRILSGNFAAGKISKGRLIYPKKSGETDYNGDFNEQGLPQGKGIMIYKKGRYDGEFKNGKRNGSGKMVFYNRTEAQDGVWENDEFKRVF